MGVGRSLVPSFCCLRCFFPSGYCCFSIFQFFLFVFSNEFLCYHQLFLEARDFVAGTNPRITLLWFLYFFDHLFIDYYCLLLHFYFSFVRFPSLSVGGELLRFALQLCNSGVIKVKTLINYS